MHRVALAVAVLGVAAGPGWAQGAMSQDDMMAMVHEGAANQYGVLQYCQAQGHVGADAVTAARTALTQMPPATAKSEAAEALGKQGTIAVGGMRMPLSAMAAQHSVSVPAMCKQLGEMAMQGG